MRCGWLGQFVSYRLAGLLARHFYDLIEK